MRYLLAALTLSLALVGPLPAQAATPGGVTSTTGVVVCVSPPAAKIGADALAKGGNAVDAAVATAFALAVSWPEAGNIGGGGFMLVQPAGSVPASFFDYREAAPAAATADMFAKTVDYGSILTAGVPGSVSGLSLAHTKFGKLPWKELVLPAAELAANGVPVDAALARSLNAVLDAKTTTNAEFRRVYGKPGGKSGWAAGDTLKLPDLAATLRLIAEKGSDGFYAGALAEMVADEMRASGGIMTKADLAGYQAKERPPIVSTYRGYDIVAAPPPSSGGVTLSLMLNVLETFDLVKHPRQSPETVHLMAEAMRRAYRDRAAYLGDPDFTPYPAKLLTKGYARELATTIDPKRATPSESIAGDIKLTPVAAESDETTHFSVVDRDGMAVSNTTTLENSYGCRVVVRGAGFLLNNEMTDFNHRPGVTDRTGRIGTPANVVAPGKRMLSSMCPVVVRKNGKTVLVTGSPGGRTIINTVACVVVNFIDYGMTARQAVDAPRQHMQWLPDRLSLEDSPQFPALKTKLEAMGTNVTKRRQGDAHTISIDPATGVATAAADRRIGGAAEKPAK
jgi:gamma-glutamyltranspeptidase/glutathione hydrolase